MPTVFDKQVRKNKFIEILPINVGCLGACTYCKTKHARGHLGSYTVSSLVSTPESCVFDPVACFVFLFIIFTAVYLSQLERVKAVISEGVKEIWLSSEDTGAYGMFLHIHKMGI